MALELDETVTPIKRPDGVKSMRVGCTIRISKNYNSIESHFSAEADVTSNSQQLKNLQIWVQQTCVDQTEEILPLLDIHK